MPEAEVPSPEATQKDEPSKSRYNVRWRWIIAGVCLLAFGLLLPYIATLYYTDKLPFIKAQGKHIVSVDHPVVVSPARSNRQSKKQTESSSDNSAASNPSANPFVAASMMQTSPVFPQATPTPAEGKKKKKNILQKFGNWLKGVCRWARLCEKKETPLENRPASVDSVRLDNRTVTTSCPSGYLPGEGAVCRGEMSVNVSTSASDPENDVLTYNYSVSGGRIVGAGANVSWDLSGVQPGTYTITVGVVDNPDCGVCGKTVTETVTVAGCSCAPIRQPCPDCPLLMVDGPSDVTKPGETMSFTANVDGGNPTYSWSVSSGEILSGQGTPSITVQTTSEMQSSNVTATVNVMTDTLSDCPSCNLSDSVTAAVGPAPKPGTEGTISGKIVDKNKNAREGIEVIVKNSKGKIYGPYYTDANGRFISDPLPLDTYTVTVTLDGETKSVTIPLTGTQSNAYFDFTPTSPSPVPTLSPGESPTPTPEESPTVTPTLSPTPVGKTKHDKIEIRHPERVLPETDHDVSFSLEDTPVPIMPTNRIITANSGNNAVATNVNRVIRTESTVSPRGKCENCTVYARPRLIPLKESLVITKEAENPVRIYDGKLEKWEWKIRTTLKEGEEALFKIELDFELRSNSQDESLPDYWKNSPEIPMQVGLPIWISIIKSTSGGAGMLGMFGGLVPRKRRKDGEEDDAGETPDAVPSPPPPDAGDEVHATTYAPSKAKAGSNFKVQVFAHLLEQAAEIEKTAADENRNAVRQDSIKFDEPIERGSKLTFSLRMPGLETDEPVQTYVWKGEVLEVPFIIFVPKDYPLGESFGKIIVSQDTMPIGRLNFTVEIVSAAAETRETPPVAVNMNRYQAAFISYASKDRPEVLKRVQMLKAQRTPFFHDMISLNPGDRWKKELYKNIDKCDVLYLFWSEAAKKSEWVIKEVLYAYQLQAGKDTAPPDIIPIPIEGPPPVAPPDTLNFLHFNDEFIYLIYAAEAEKKTKEN